MGRHSWHFAGVFLLALFALPAPWATLQAAERLDSTVQGTALLDDLTRFNYRLTPQVEKDYLDYAKAQALREIAATGKSLPPDFLAWIDSDPIVHVTVYGARQQAANVLLMLRSLDLDLGSDAVRNKYTQLALAMAVVEAKQGATADITPRSPMKLVVPGDPRHPVNTHAKDRPLDKNDYIINFLEDHAPINGDTFGRCYGPPELKYDANGAAMLVRTMNAKPAATPLQYDMYGMAAVVPPIPGTTKRPLMAADVLESKQLQEEFNAYMVAHGQNIHIDCGDHQITPNTHDMIVGTYAKGIFDAYMLFRTAYEAKGRLPAQRDAPATPAECCAYLIRNDNFHFPPEIAASRLWPRYPLNAPWPTLTLLAAADYPLRERDELWTRFADTGEMVCYGEYDGMIAQQGNYQAARRLTPYPFGYGSYQMMLKDGGVCGTMANMEVRTENALGVPTCTAGQPEHCALIHFGYDAKSNAYFCRGAQYATGGDDNTHPHVKWVFGDTDQLRDMVWYQSVAWGVNAGFQSYLDSMLALDIYRVLPDPERKEHGLALLAGGLSVDPYNFALVEAAQKDAGTETLQVAFDAYFKKLFADRTASPNCPVSGLYNTTVEKLFLRNLEAIKPVNKIEAQQTLAYLNNEGISKGRAVTAQLIAIDGLPAVMKNAVQSYAAYIASERFDADDLAMAATIDTVSAYLPDKRQRAAWVSSLGTLATGRDYRFNQENQVVNDDSVTQLIKLEGYRKPPLDQCYRVLQQQVDDALKASVSGQRTIPECRKLATRIASLSRAMKNAGEPAKAWQTELHQILAGKETFLPPTARRGAKPVTDPCVAAIAGLSQTAG